jgi:antitoxin (DNA-binding transcriptional repressor) of toxin-antitoxin stability system
MKSIPLRQLLREPIRVKRITRAGQSVRITDHGQPLWILQPALAKEDSPERARAIDELLDEVLREPVSSLNLSKIVKDGRR